MGSMQIWIYTTLTCFTVSAYVFIYYSAIYQDKFMKSTVLYKNIFYIKG